MQNLLYSFILGVFIAGFLIVFQPFGISRWESESKVLHLLAFGGVTFGILVFMKVGVMKVFPNYFKEEKWTVGREILINFTVLCLITIGNFLYAVNIHLFPFKWEVFLWSFSAVVSLGVFPIFFNVFLKYKRGISKYSEPVMVGAAKEEKETDILLKAENGKDSLNLKAGELFFLESADNYSKVVFTAENELKQELLRGSLSSMESQILDEKIVRCHRSYIVNLNKTEKVTGNAQGYKLHLNGIETVIPVARKYSSIVADLK
ncbi:LytTR family DNA-binding domain-containing protein [uncultured Arcticibacterium sp.]|uniref:LytR/AlgR family response regulator transcription factor n=1 Tax=uncultured Arcticibacterium sp. TaxID=2173042 RepID=UPI0030FD1505